MDWIKKNPSQLALALVAVIAIAATALLYGKVSGFASNFEGIRGTSVSKSPVERLNTEALDAASKAIQTPVAWEPAKGSGKLFISKFYALKDGKLIRPEGTMFHPPVTNKWLLKYNLDPLSSSILNDDPDQDGFTNLDEWMGLDGLSHLDSNGQIVMGADGQPLPDDSTDPTKADSHPPYHTKLELAKVVYIPFRLRLMSYDINPRKPAEVTVAINTIDRGGRTLFIEVGKEIPGTRFTTESFKQKEVPGKDGTTTDASELTIKNTETGEKVALPLKQVVDSPDSYAIFHYKWKKPGVAETPDFSKRRGDTFFLQPDTDKIYKLEEIKGQDAVVTLPNGAKKTLTAPR